MATLIQALALSGSCKPDGLPNSGGLVTLTQPGSDAAVTAYADRDASAPLPLDHGGYRLDAGGRAQLFVNQPARARIQDALGNTVGELTAATDLNAALVEVQNDGFTGPDASSGQQVAGGRTSLDQALTYISDSLGGPNGTYLAGAGATSMLVHKFLTGVHVDVRSFGALCDGVHDDTLSIQAAVNFAQANVGSIVHFPPGTCLISATIAIGAVGLEVTGSGTTSTLIETTSATISAFAFNIPSSAPLSCRISKIGITGSQTSTGAAIDVTGTTGIFVEDVSIPAEIFRYGVRVNASSGLTVVHGSGIVVNSADSASVAIDVTGAGGTVFVSDTRLASYATAAIAVTSSATVVISNLTTVGQGSSANGVTVSGAGTLLASSCDLRGGASGHGVSLGASTADAIISGCKVSPDILDARVGSPVNFSLSADGSVTVLPFRTPSTRIVATAAITVTLADPGTADHGRRHTISFVNSSGGAVTWTLNANFHTSASVAPTNGNRISVTFEYDAVSAHWYEVSRSASVAN